jgi:metal-responsive CopG/Arc/MetJ family transcriptional regulator
MKPLPPPELLALEPLQQTAIKLPTSMLSAIDERSRLTFSNRSHWIRQALYRELIRKGKDQ